MKKMQLHRDSVELVRNHKRALEVAHIRRVRGLVYSGAGIILFILDIAGSESQLILGFACFLFIMGSIDLESADTLSTLAAMDERWNSNESMKVMPGESGNQKR